MNDLKFVLASQRVSDGLSPHLHLVVKCVFVERYMCKWGVKHFQFVHFRPEVVENALVDTRVVECVQPSPQRNHY